MQACPRGERGCRPASPKVPQGGLAQTCRGSSSQEEGSRGRGEEAHSHYCAVLPPQQLPHASPPSQPAADQPACAS